jgi:hypothetical protein
MFPLAALSAASLLRYENTAAGGSSLGIIEKWSRLGVPDARAACVARHKLGKAIQRP